jgi:TolB protein
MQLTKKLIFLGQAFIIDFNSHLELKQQESLVMQKSFLILSLLLSFWISSLPAAEPPTITVRKSDAVNVAFSPIGGSEGAAVTKIVANDLSLAGSLHVEPPSKASFAISGIATGNALQGRVVDRGGSLVLSKSYVGDPRAMAHRFCDDIVETLTGHPGIATSKIAFVSTRTGRKEIYTADYDGSNGRQITHDNGISVSPSLSPNGRKLAYTGYLNGYADIYLVDLMTGGRQRLVKFPGTNSGPRFSPDGNRLACTLSKDGHPSLYIVGLHDGVLRLTRTRGAESCGTWAPNGNELIYSSDQHGAPQLYRISATGGAGHLVPTGFGYATEPNWSPDGAYVAFNIRSGGGFAVAVLDLGSGSARIVAQGENPVWGPDSRHLLFSTKHSLVLFDVPSGRSMTVVSGLGEVTEPSWSR